jgi:hypothetical protein
MNQADLIAAVAEHASLTNAGKAVEALVDTITEALKRGDEVRIAGFGTFGISEHGGPQPSDRRADHDRGGEGCQVYRRQGCQGRPQRLSRVGTVLPRTPGLSDRGWIQEVFAEGRRC